MDESEIDWNATWIALRRCIRVRLGRCDDQELDRLAQVASVGVLRVARQGGVQNLQGLIATVGRRTAGGEIRRRRRERARMVDWDERRDEIENLPAPLMDDRGDSYGRLTFLMHEFFRLNHAPCLELAERYAQHRNWTDVAAALGKSYEAVSQQWSRCRKRFREWIERDPNLMDAFSLTDA